MKKMFLALLLAVVALNASAQFEKKTKYMNGSLTGLDINYSKNTKFRMGLEAMGGYFIEDSWMAYGRLGYDHQYVKGASNDVDNFNLGAGARYYFTQNGIFLGCGLLYEYAHSGVNTHNIDLTPEVGYCFYINHFVSLEPSVYYNLCMNHFTDGSKVGLKLGIGIYF